jgi:hypothetical protein
MGNENGNGDPRVKLSLSQILMVATMLVTLAVGWGTLKAEVDSVKELVAAHGTSLATLANQITQIRIDMAEDRKESRAARRK